MCMANESIRGRWASGALYLSRRVSMAEIVLVILHGLEIGGSRVLARSVHVRLLCGCHLALVVHRLLSLINVLAAHAVGLELGLDFPSIVQD